MPTLHRECGSNEEPQEFPHSLIMKNRKNFPFLLGRGKALPVLILAGPINVSIDLKYDVLCL